MLDGQVLDADAKPSVYQEHLDAIIAADRQIRCAGTTDAYPLHRDQRAGKDDGRGICRQTEVDDVTVGRVRQRGPKRTGAAVVSIRHGNRAAERGQRADRKQHRDHRGKSAARLFGPLKAKTRTTESNSFHLPLLLAEMLDTPAGQLDTPAGQ